MLLGRVDKQIFKVNLKNIFVFYLTVLFCCDVGESDINEQANHSFVWVTGFLFLVFLTIEDIFNEQDLIVTYLVYVFHMVLSAFM